jgi:hypothetical protein
MDEGPNPDENEEPGARLDRFTPSGCKKGSPGACSGGRVEMLLVITLLATEKNSATSLQLEKYSIATSASNWKETRL